MVLYFPVSDLTHLLTSLILVPLPKCLIHTPHASSPMLPFQTPYFCLFSFTFSLLAHPISKSLSHPDLAHSPLSAPTFQDLLFSLWDRSHSCSFFSFLAIPSQSCRYSLPGLGHCPYPVVSGVRHGF